MGIRESLNQSPAITTGATTAIILVALGLIVWQFLSTSSGSSGQAQSFFTVDDGNSFFLADGTNTAPFDYKGKTAYLATVYTCDGGKTKFVAYLKRYTPEAKKVIDDLNSGKQIDQGTQDRALSSGSEVKLPKTGDDPKNWVKEASPQGQKLVMDVNCPPGAGGGTLEMILPQ